MKKFLIVSAVVIVSVFLMGAATDTYGGFRGALSSPYVKAFAITPHDTNQLGYVTRAIYVGGAGNIHLQLADDSASVTIYGALAGSTITVRARLVGSTYTTATHLVGLY